MVPPPIDDNNGHGIISQIIQAVFTPGSTMFRFGVTLNVHGHLKFGDCRNEVYTSGIRFLQGDSEVYITDGNDGLGNIKADKATIKSCDLGSIGDLQKYLE